MRKILFSVSALLFYNLIFSQPLSDNEKKIISYINLHMTDAEKMLSDAVNINSGTLNVDCIDGLGASGRGAHATGETINLKEFPSLIKRAAILIYRLTHTE